MDNSIRQYRLAEAEQERLLDQWRATDHPSDLTREIALMRTLIDDAASKGQHSMVNTLVTTLSKLSRSQLAHSRAMNSLLDRSVVLRLGSDLLRVIAKHFEDVPDYEERMIRASEAVQAEICKAQNPRIGDI